MLLLFIILLFPNEVLAYKPYYVPRAERINVTDPGDAKGYYVQMHGKTVSFVFKLDDPEVIDAELRIPNVPGAQKSLLMEVFYTDQNGEKQKLIKGPGESDWEYYKDDFTGNDYFIDQKINIAVASGTHVVRISSPPDNEKPFVFIVGKNNEMTLRDHYNKIIELGKIKNSVYHDFPFKAYYNYYGIILLIPTVLIIILAIFIGVKIYLRIKREDEQEAMADESEENSVE